VKKIMPKSVIQGRRIPMRTFSFFLSAFLILCVSTASAGTFISGSTGADGAFNPTVSTELQLPPNGIFNFTTVNIPPGITVTFKKNAANTPVYILATGNVTILGWIVVDGGWTDSSGGNAPGVGGPGGYDGGYGGMDGAAGGAGLGPGGGSAGIGGSFGTLAQCNQAGTVYGNVRVIPLLGGSGGGGQNSASTNPGNGGAGGAGAILIASSGTINITNGVITAIGGMSYRGLAGGGSGGTIKLVANTISDSYYTLHVDGGPGSCYGGYGRIRLEAFNIGNITSFFAYSTGLPSSVFLSNIPTLSITSIAGVNVPSSPTASFLTPDLALPNTTTNPVAVALSASYIPAGANVTVSATPQYGNTTTANAALIGTGASSTAIVNINLSTDYVSVIMAYITYSLQAAMYYDGEKINRVRVASSMGGKSEAVYITESGHEIKAEKLILAGLLK